MFKIEQEFGYHVSTRKCSALGENERRGTAGAWGLWVPVHPLTASPPALEQVLSSAFTVALSGRCDRRSLRLLLLFPEDYRSGFATKELCGLPASKVYSLLVSMSKNLNLRSVIYKVSGVTAGVA